MNFVNKVVLVTGAASGIGEKTAELFSYEGASVVTVDIDEAGLKNVATRCKPNGNAIYQVVANLTDDNDTKRVIDEAVGQFGKIVILVNCAGTIKDGLIIDSSILKTYDHILNLNLRAIVYRTTVAAPYLVKSKGNIINISSIKAVYNTKKYAYDISKAGIEHFTRGSAIELSPLGVRVNPTNTLVKNAAFLKAPMSIGVA